MYAPQPERDPFAITRLGVIMRPRPDNPQEEWGALNPACARGRDGQLYLFPRIVAEGNYSRIAIARVVFDGDGNPSGVERLGIALEPREPYEQTPRWGGGVEDPRVTYIPLLDAYVMTYTALNKLGPRIALAVSRDLFHWARLGIVDFAPDDGIDWNEYHNKDAVVFPEPVMGPEGRPMLALIHRPNYLVSHHDGVVERRVPPGVRDERESLWISYADPLAARQDIGALTRFGQHRQLAVPEARWENVKIGAGAPPLLTHLGWLLIYHGVFGEIHAVSPEDPHQRHLIYSAGAMVLDRADPRRILYRSKEPILEPATDEERQGVVDNVVFPCGLDPRTPPAPGSRVDVYYGMADTLVGAGRITLPAGLPDR
ncbi:MAG TPA: hypothetical protein VIC85_09195 [Ktedonobacterales bacterium]